jgi:hypothetical protein
VHVADRALARREGCRIPTGYPEGFVARVEKLEVLVEAAWVLLRTKQLETQALRMWALGIAQRRGERIAAVTLARRHPLRAVA